MNKILPNLVYLSAPAMNVPQVPVLWFVLTPWGAGRQITAVCTGNQGSGEDR